MYGACRHIRGVLGTYRCMGNVQMYRGHIDVWGCTDVWQYTDVWGIQAYGGMNRAIQRYGGMQTYMGHTDIWGIQTYRGHTMYGGVQMYGTVQMWDSFRHPPRHTDSQTYPSMPANYTWVLYLL